jgi:hypothetical protein
MGHNTKHSDKTLAACFAVIAKTATHNARRTGNILGEIIAVYWCFH